MGGIIPPSVPILGNSQTLWRCLTGRHADRRSPAAMQACVAIAAEGRTRLLRWAMLAIAKPFPPATTRKPAPDPVWAWLMACRQHRLRRGPVALGLSVPSDGHPLRRCGSDGGLQSAIAIMASATARPSRRCVLTTPSPTSIWRRAKPRSLAVFATSIGASMRHRLKARARRSAAWAATRSAGAPHGNFSRCPKKILRRNLRGKRGTRLGVRFRRVCGASR